MNDSELKAAMERANLPGAAWMVVDRDGTRLAGATGLANTADGAAMQLDTQCQIASMTKPLVSVAAMQLVEKGLLDLDAPIGNVLPELAAPELLTGFDESGAPQTRTASKPITLRHLLTHTAGFGYFFVHEEVVRFFGHAGIPAPGERAGIEMPLMFEPGERWEYSVATDWVGQAIEAVTGERLRDYLGTHVLAPLEMEDTAFHDAPPTGIASVHVRHPDGGFEPIPMFIPNAEYDSGGGGLVSTAKDYARFMRAILRGGELDGQRILQESTVGEMGRNQVGDLRAGYLGTTAPELALVYDAIPDQHTGWGLGYLINPETGPNGRSADSLGWSGIFNSYFWIDPAAGIAGVFIAQLSPFADPGALQAFGALERLAYS